MKKFEEAIFLLKKSTKTNERLEKAVMSLESFNTFFKKTQRVISVCLLRIGKVLFKHSQHLLYQEKNPY